MATCHRWGLASCTTWRSKGAVITRVDATWAMLELFRKSGPRGNATTNMRMEMTAAPRGLRALGRKAWEDIVVVSDTRLVMQGVSEWGSVGRLMTGASLVVRRSRTVTYGKKLIATAEGGNIARQRAGGHKGKPLKEEVDRLAY